MRRVTDQALERGSPPEGGPGIRERLLDAAERLLAETGVSGTSIRDITAAAGANVAAVNYYFGSREAFMRELISRRLAPLNTERLRLLDACLTPTGARPDPEAVLYALAAPALRLCFEHPHFARLAGRLRGELDRSLWSDYRAHQADVTERFRQAFAAALPHLPPDEISTRLHYVLGGLMHLWAHAPLDQPLDEVQKSFLAFFGAGLLAFHE